MIKTILECSERATNERTCHSVLGKMVEEIGEVSKALNQPHRCDEELPSEVADLMIAAIDLVYVYYRDNPHYDYIPRDQLKQCVQMRIMNDMSKKSFKWMQQQNPRNKG